MNEIKGFFSKVSNARAAHPTDSMAYRVSLGRAIQGGTLIALTLSGLVGCSSLPALGLSAKPLELNLTASAPAEPMPRALRPVILGISRYADARTPSQVEKIGDITASVSDMLGTELLMRDVAGTVTTSMENQLRASGFEAIADPGKGNANVDFTLSGSVKEFRMNIAGRDEVAIAVESTLRDARNGDILWSGVVAEKADRFAGVSGNSRATITRSLGGALAQVTGKTRDALGDAIRRARPDLFQHVAAARPSAPGVTLLIAPPEPAQIPHPAQPQAASLATGRLTLSSTPPRAKVYLAEIYFGLTPLSLELEPGIYTLQLKLDGFRSATEKVSVRKGETTELEAKLEK